VTVAVDVAPCGSRIVYVKVVVPEKSRSGTNTMWPCDAGRQRHRRTHRAHPVAQRAEAAVIAWMRHQTTAYDRRSIARVKGERREVRRRLAQRSRELLERYRRGADIDADCPLAAALALAPGAITREVEDDDDDDTGVASEGDDEGTEDADEGGEVDEGDEGDEDEVVSPPAPRTFVTPTPRTIIPAPRTPPPTNDGRREARTHEGDVDSAMRGKLGEDERQRQRQNPKREPTATKARKARLIATSGQSTRAIGSCSTARMRSRTEMATAVHLPLRA